MADDIMSIVWGRPVRRTARHAQYYDPMADITRTMMGGVTAMVGVTVGTTLLGMIQGMKVK